MSQKARIVCRTLTKKYGNQFGLHNINLDVEFTGLGLLGPNGSGKTTFIKSLLGIISPTNGSIEINVPRSEIRVVSDNPKLPDEMTIDEWVYTIEEMHGNLFRDIDVQTDLGLEGHWKLKNLSAGQRRKAALLPAFYGKPKLIILDEPSNYLDISTREYILNILKSHCETTGASIIISTHNVDEIRLFASDVIMLKQGRIIHNIKIEEEVPEFYSIETEENDKLGREFAKDGLVHFIDTTIQGEVVKVEPSDRIWSSLDRFIADGGIINSFKTIDVIERMIEELTK